MHNRILPALGLLGLGLGLALALYIIQKCDSAPVPLYRLCACTENHKICCLFTSDNGGGRCFRPCTRLSVCLCARLHKNACMNMDEMLRVDRYRDMDELINL